MKSFNDFSEKIDHEFNHVPSICFDVFGVRVDEDGLKKYCKLNQLKSVDYIYPKNKEFSLLEFSDLARQHFKILKKIDEIKKSNDLQKATKRELVINAHKEINKELVDKYKDTRTIVSQLEHHVSDVPSELRGRSKYYIVYAPFHHEIEESKKIEISRFLDDIKGKISLAIPDSIFYGVSVMLIDEFVAYSQI